MSTVIQTQNVETAQEASTATVVPGFSVMGQLAPKALVLRVFARSTSVAFHQLLTSVNAAKDLIEISPAHVSI